VHKNKLIVVVIFIIISFFVVRHSMRLGVSVVEVVSSSALYPLLRAQQFVIVPIAAWFDRRATMHDLEGRIHCLQQENEKLLAENIELKAFHSHSDQTAELRNFNKRYQLHKGCMAQVLARHFSSSNQFFLVDAGFSQGIKKDMVVLYGNNIVGRVAAVYPWYCKVCLITDSDCKVAAIAGKSNATGIHEGNNDALSTTMRYVSHLASVDKDDTVLSSGEGLVFPKGFALGKVISADKNDLFYTITVKPALDFNAVRYCTLIAKEDIT